MKSILRISENQALRTAVQHEIDPSFSQDEKISYRIIKSTYNTSAC
jgi:hypothetical protein